LHSQRLAGFDRRSVIEMIQEKLYAATALFGVGGVQRAGLRTFPTSIPSKSMANSVASIATELAPVGI
jgi:hypothetical protein